MKPEVSIPVALATGAVVVGVFQAMSPSNADVRTVAPGSRGDDFLAGAERSAFFVSVGVVGGISLIARDPIPFVIGGLMACAMAWTHRYARVVDPATGKLSLPGGAAGGRLGTVYEVQAAG